MSIEALRKGLDGMYSEILSNIKSGNTDELASIFAAFGTTDVNLVTGMVSKSQALLPSLEIMAATVENLRTDSIAGGLSTSDLTNFVALQTNGADGFYASNAFVIPGSNRIYYVKNNFSGHGFGKQVAIMGHEVTHHLGTNDPKPGVNLSPINNAHRWEDYYEFR